MNNPKANSIYDNILNDGPLPDLTADDINFNKKWDGVDHDFLSSDSSGENDPKVKTVFSNSQRLA